MTDLSETHKRHTDLSTEQVDRALMNLLLLNSETLNTETTKALSALLGDKIEDFSNIEARFEAIGRAFRDILNNIDDTEGDPDLDSLNYSLNAVLSHLRVDASTRDHNGRTLLHHIFGYMKPHQLAYFDANPFVKWLDKDAWQRALVHLDNQDRIAFLNWGTETGGVELAQFLLERLPDWYELYRDSNAGLEPLLGNGTTLFEQLAAEQPAVIEELLNRQSETGDCCRPEAHCLAGALRAWLQSNVRVWSISLSIKRIMQLFPNGYSTPKGSTHPNPVDELFLGLSRGIKQQQSKEQSAPNTATRPTMQILIALDTIAHTAPDLMDESAWAPSQVLRLLKPVFEAYEQAETGASLGDLKDYLSRLHVFSMEADAFSAAGPAGPTL